MVSDDREWSMLMDSIKRIEDKANRIDAKMNALCSTLEGTVSTVKDHGTALKFLYGILSAVVIALVVAWIRNGG